MKDFFRAYKLYFKASFSPILVGFGMFFLAIIGLGLIFAGAKLTDDDYMSMIGLIGMVNVFQVLWLVWGKTTITTNKFFFSANCNKALFTTAPIAAVLTVEMICSIILMIISYFALESSAMPDVILILAFNMVFSCFTISMARMPKMAIPFIICYMALFSQPVIFNHNYFKGIKGFGFELPQAVLISAVMLIAGISLNIFILNIWWKKSGRNFKIVPQNNAFVFGNK